MKMLHSNIVFLALICLFLSHCKKDTDLGEALVLRSVINKTTLKNHSKGIDYIIQANDFNVNGELIIEPGVEIVIDNNLKININSKGSITAKGLKNEPIVFKSRQLAWKGLVFDHSKNNSFEHVKFSTHESSNNKALISFKGDSKVSFNYCEFSGSQQINGFFIGPSATLELNNSVISNFKYPFQFEFGAQLNGLINNRIYCLYNQILIENEDETQLIVNKTVRIKHLGLDYFIPSDILVENDSLIIEKGTTLIMKENTEIRTSNNDVLLSFLGNKQSPIIIKTGHEKQYWNGLKINGGKANLFFINFEGVIQTDTFLGVITVFNNGNLNVKYSNFLKNKTLCSVVTRNFLSKVNSDVNINNFFNKSKYCSYLK